MFSDRVVDFRGSYQHVQALKELEHATLRFTLGIWNGNSFGNKAAEGPDPISIRELAVIIPRTLQTKRVSRFLILDLKRDTNPLYFAKK